MVINTTVGHFFRIFFYSSSFIFVHMCSALSLSAISVKHFTNFISGARVAFAIAVLLLAIVTRTASDCALGLLAAGLVAVASASRKIDAWEKLWQVAWITLPWAYALETAFMSNEALSAWRVRYTALRWLAASAAGLMGVVHGRLLSILKSRLATGTAVTQEMWAIFYARRCDCRRCTRVHRVFFVSGHLCVHLPEPAKPSSSTCWCTHHAPPQP